MPRLLGKFFLLPGLLVFLLWHSLYFSCYFYLQLLLRGMSAVLDLFQKLRPSGISPVDHATVDDESQDGRRCPSTSDAAFATTGTDSTLLPVEPSVLATRTKGSDVIEQETGGNLALSLKPNRRISFQTTETPSTGTTDRSTAAFSSPHEVYLGEQSIPFIFRRQNVSHPDATPSKLPAFFRPPTLSGRIAISDDTELKDVIKDCNVAANDVIMVENVASEMLGRPVTISQLETCEWRKEQMKFCKRARLPNGATYKSIAPLMGPLSLPYARNPSGVDAIVADKNEYLANVWGLRAVPDAEAPHTDTGNPEAPRNVSGGSAVTTSSSKSWNSGDSKKVNTTSNTSTSHSTTSSQKVMIRDPYQSIGLRKSSSGKTEVTERIREVEKIQKRIANAVQQSAIEPRQTTTRRVNVPLDIQSEKIAAESAPLLVARSLRTQGAGHELSPIPGSPAGEEGKDVFNDLFEHALHSAKPHSASSSDLQSTREIHIHQRGHSVPMPLRASHPRVFMGNREQLRGAQPILLAPAPKVVLHASSKADASGNWRMKKDQPSEDRLSAVVNSLSPVSAAVLRSYQDDSMLGDVAMDLLSIDSGIPADHQEVTVKPPNVDPTISAMSCKPFAVNSEGRHSLFEGPAESTNPSQTNGVESDPANKPLRKAKRASTAKTLSAKGTPNAGRLLRKGGVTVAYADVSEMPPQVSGSFAKANKGSAKATEAKPKG